MSANRSLRTEVIRIASEHPETRKHLIPLLKKAMDPQVKEMLRVFNNQHPYHNDLDLIDSQRRTLIGTGRFDIPGRRAGMLAKLGLVNIMEGAFGKELSLTSRGRTSLNNSREDFSLI